MSPQSAGALKTILVVDDDTNVLQAVHSALKRRRYEVLQAQSAEEAIAAVQRHSSEIDLLLMDAVMPKMSGPELADILLFLRPNMKVLFISGLNGFAVQLAFNHPCESLQKPFTPRFLISKIEQTLGHAEPVSEENPG